MGARLAKTAIRFGHDAVGNRLQKTSTLPGYPGGLSNYNANDELTTDAYDADGNTVGSGTNTGTNGYVYDFENHLIQQAGIGIVYDGDGNRVSKTVAGVTTKFLVDDINPTGYAQVVDEVQSSAVVRTYTWGLELISEVFPPGSPLATGHSPLSYYVFDGHGSVRALTNSTGAVTDTYDYDAFGNLIHSTGTTPNNYLFAGEQFDPDLNLYYNRARYLNTSTGRFWSMDMGEGDDETPLSLHKYIYANADPSNEIDPSGNEGIDELSASFAISGTINSLGTINRSTLSTVTHFPFHARQTGSTDTIFHDKTPGPLPDGAGGLLCQSCFGAVRFYNYVLLDGRDVPFTEPVRLHEFIDPIMYSEPINASVGSPQVPAGKFFDALAAYRPSSAYGYYYFKGEQTFTAEYRGQTYPLATKVTQYIARIKGAWLISAFVDVP